MVNKKMLRSKMAIAGVTQKQLGLLVGMSENTMSAKINGKSRLYADEVIEICKTLSIEDPVEMEQIFLQSTSQ